MLMFSVVDVSTEHGQYLILNRLTQERSRLKSFSQVSFNKHGPGNHWAAFSVSRFQN